MEEKSCPNCGGPAGRVRRVTVRSLLLEPDANGAEDAEYNICLAEGCPVVYFNDAGTEVYEQSQIKVPVAYKGGAEPKYVCYCSKVTEAKVKEAIAKGAWTVAGVCKLTGAMKHSNCARNNPMGRCCREEIQGLIDQSQTGE